MDGLDPTFARRMEALNRRRRDLMTIKNNEHALRKHDAWLRSQGLSADTVTPEVMETYFEELLDEYRVSTARRHLTSVRAAYAYEVKLGLRTSDPTSTVVMPRIPDSEPETYSNEELRTILAAVETDREEGMFHLLAYAGLRRCEAVGLLDENADLAHQQLKVLGKGKKFRLVPVHPALGEVLVEQRRRARPDRRYTLESAWRDRMSFKTFNDSLNVLLERAGVDGGARPAHKFRKTVATSMFEQGVRESVIDKILGWAPPTVRARHYTRIADRLMHEAILTLYADDPISLPHGSKRP